MGLRIGTVLLILGLVFFRALGSICGWHWDEVASKLFPALDGGLIQECFKPSALRHVQASAHGFGPSPVVISELLGSLSGSPTLTPFSLVLSKTAPWSFDALFTSLTVCSSSSSGSGSLQTYPLTAEGFWMASGFEAMAGVGISVS